MRARWRTRRTALGLTWLSALTVLPGSVLTAFPAHAQEVRITPEFSVTPSTETTQWIYIMAILTAALGGVALLGLLSGYLRFAPKFFGREGRSRPSAPGTRPRLLPTTSGRPPDTRPAMVTARAGTAAATRPAPESRPAPEPEPAAEATDRPTAPPAGEQATQADAVGQTEAAAPEERPTAKTRAETGAEPEAAAAPEATAEAGAAAPTEQPTDRPTGGSLDQETFDRVLEEQLAKGVDRRVAEGRARAAAVVAARKKAQA